MPPVAIASQPGLLDLVAPRSGSLAVEVVDGQTVVSRQIITAQAVVGRAIDAQIRLDRGTVSRQHAEVMADPFGRWWIRDLGSRNGILFDGVRVQERLIRNGDECRVGDFLLRFRLADESEESTRGDDETAVTHQTTIVPITDGDIAGISTAQDLESPSLKAAHLSLLLESGRQFLQSEQQEARLITLCQLTLRPEFKGTAAMALRVSPATLDSPQMLCPVQSAVGHGSRPPVSKTLLRAMLERGAPAMAGNSRMLDVGPEMVEMSMMTTLRPVCAVACPLKSLGGGVTDVLYVIFPSECANGEWLAIVALAAEQFKLAESAWAARQEAMRHAEIERDLRQATDIQRRLIPADLSVAGFQVAVGFQPCRWVGGDYTDAAILPDGRVFLAVADVCGKGLGAALVSSSLHTLVRSMLMDDGIGLEKIMDRLNRLLTDFLDSGKFVTMAAALFDPRTGIIEHVNAGHPPILIIDRTGRFREVGCTDNLPLAVDSTEIFRLAVDRLEPGQMLAMFTDGLTEARTAIGDMVGTERLHRELAAIHISCYAAGLDDARTRVVAFMETISGGRPQDDDRTYLLARRV